MVTAKIWATFKFSHRIVCCVAFARAFIVWISFIIVFIGKGINGGFLRSTKTNSRKRDWNRYKDSIKTHGRRCWCFVAISFGLCKLFYRHKCSTITIIPLIILFIRGQFSYRIHFQKANTHTHTLCLSGGRPILHFSFIRRVFHFARLVFDFMKRIFSDFILYIMYLMYVFITRPQTFT